MSFALLALAVVSGVIDPRLSIEERSWATFTFKTEASSAARAHQGELRWDEGPSAAVRIVESLDGIARLHLDRNRDGAFGADEWVAFHPVEGPPLSRIGRPVAEARMIVRLAGKSFPYLPIFVRIFEASKSILPDGGRIVSVSMQPFVRAKVELNGSGVTLLYEYDVERDAVDARRGWLGLVTNETEWKYADNEEVSFVHNGRRLTTAAVDLRSRRVTVSFDE